VDLGWGPLAIVGQPGSDGPADSRPQALTVDLSCGRPGSLPTKPSSSTVSPRHHAHNGSLPGSIGAWLGYAAWLARRIPCAGQVSRRRGRGRAARATGQAAGFVALDGLPHSPTSPEPVHGFRVQAGRANGHTSPTCRNMAAGGAERARDDDSRRPRGKAPAIHVMTQQARCGVNARPPAVCRRDPRHARRRPRKLALAQVPWSSVVDLHWRLRISLRSGSSFARRAPRPARARSRCPTWRVGGGVAVHRGLPAAPGEDHVAGHRRVVRRPAGYVNVESVRALTGAGRPAMRRSASAWPP